MKITLSQYLKQNKSGLISKYSKSELGKKNTTGKIKHGNDKDIPTAAGSSAAVVTRARTRNSINTFSNPPGTSIKILFDSIDKSVDKLNVIVEFIDMNALWLTRVYKTYENELWHKEPRSDSFKKNKWLFYCRLCNNVYRQFDTMKRHLNIHLNFYPYVCKICQRKYANRKSATSHLRSVHNLGIECWNDFLTS